jgi:hypothetical protein
MLDALLILGTIAFFGLCVAYAHGLERLGR